MLALAAVALSATSCSDDDTTFSADADRLFMPQFRLTQNLNNTTTLYHCDIASRVDPQIETWLNENKQPVSTHVNDIRLFWYTVNDAVGYELKAKVQGTSWEKDENPNLLDTILVGKDVNTFLHEDLQYGTGYMYAIRALADLDNPDSPRSSKWYGYGDGSHQDDHSRDDSRNQVGSLNTGMRYDVPAVFWTENMTKTSMEVHFQPKAENGYDKNFKDFIEAGAEVESGEWKFDEIRVVPSADNPLVKEYVHKLTAAEKAQGFIKVEGLESNAAYIVSGQNNDVPRYYDRQYNSIMVRMPGDPGEPILIHANTAEEAKQDTILQNMGLQQGNIYGCQDLVATRLDTVLINYMSDSKIAEGQIFYLEGGKTYYCTATVEMTKGFTLETNPEDIAAGKGRATVLQGIGYSTEKMHDGGRQVNWGLCRNARSGSENGVMLAIQPIVFRNINFHPMVWQNYYDQHGYNSTKSDINPSANYFMNMYSQGLSFTLSELRVENCCMSGHVRGFIRFQGPNRQIIDNLVVTGCVMYDDSGYDTNGRGYAWFAGPSNNPKSNFFKHLVITNNSFISSSRQALIQEGTKNMAWPDGTTWDITLSNNTFVNFATRSNNKGHGYIFEMPYIPAGSKVECKKNLFVFAGNPNDKGRFYWQKGMNVTQKDITYDFADNYSTVVPKYDKFRASNDPKGTTLIDGMFAQTAFSNPSSGAGYQNGLLNLGGMDEVKIKFGDNLNGNEPDAVGYQLEAGELFRSPWTMGVEDAKEQFDCDAYRYADISGFYYQDTEKVRKHPIYTKQIGASYWRTGEPWDGGQNVTVRSGMKVFTKAAASKRRTRSALRRW